MHPHPQPQPFIPNVFPPQQNKRIKMIQIQLLSQPLLHPQLFPPNVLPPPQNKRIKIIQRQELFPHPQDDLSLRPHPHPQFELKSPIMKPPKILFTLHNMLKSEKCEKIKK